MRSVQCLLLAVITLTACLQESTAAPTLTPLDTSVQPTTAVPLTPPPIVTLAPPHTIQPTSTPEDIPAMRLGRGPIWDSALSPDGSSLIVVSESGLAMYQVEPLQERWFVSTND